MSGQRWDVLSVREYEANGEKKTAYTRIGTMFELRNGGGFSLMLDALPIGNRLIAKVHEDKREGGQRGGGNRGGGGGYGDDNVPF